MYNKYNFNNSKNILSLFILGIIVVFISSCNPTKKVLPGELFLKKNKVKVKGDKLNKENIEAIVKQKPNRKILGVFRFHLGVYNIFNNDKIGEPPVIYDSLLTAKTVKQLKLYADNKGYFDSKVSYKTFIRNKKIKVEYKVETGEPYKIKSIHYEIADKTTESLLLKVLGITSMRIGNNFDVETLDEVREELKTKMRNLGYYYFSKDYIRYEADSTIGNKEIALTLFIDKQKVIDEERDTVYEVNHTKYYIDDINLYISKNFKNKNLYEFDTTSLKKLLFTTIAC